MFPLFPALILLLLQGPSNFERCAIDGRLPAALEAIHRQSAQLGTSGLSEHQEQVLATLIASGTEISQALLTILWRNEERTNPDVPCETGPRTHFLPADSPPSSDGFGESQRARDGPTTNGAGY